MKYYEELNDIPYNFLIGDDGSVFEGRGFKFQGQIPGNHYSSFDEVGLLVAFIGTFVDVSPSPLQIEVFDAFMQQSVRRDLLARNYILLLADQLSLSRPPAKGIFEILEARNNFHEST